MDPKAFSKQSTETRTLEFAAADSIASGDSLSSVTAVMTDEDGTDVSAAMISGSPTISGTSGFVVIKAGADGEDYNLAVTMVTTDGETIEDDLRIMVRDIRYI